GDRLHRGLARENIHDLAPHVVASIVSNTEHHIDISDSLSATTQAARYLQTHDLGHLCQNGTDTLSLFLRHRIQKTIGMLRQKSNALQNFILRLLAKAWQRRNLILFACLL